MTKGVHFGLQYHTEVMKCIETTEHRRNIVDTEVMRREKPEYVEWARWG